MNSPDSTPFSPTANIEPLPADTVGHRDLQNRQPLLPNRIDYRLIKTDKGINILLAAIHSVRHVQDPPALFVSLHGACIERGSMGTISVFTIYVAPIKTAFLVDVLFMGLNCFKYVSRENNLSIQSVLESNEIPKVFYDFRNTNNALHGTCGIKLEHVHDLMLMGRIHCTPGGRPASKTLADENLRKWRKKVMRFVKAQEERFPIYPDGNTRIFDRRPVSKTVIDHCVKLIISRASLWELYHPMPELRRETYHSRLRGWILDSRSRDYNPETNPVSGTRKRPRRGRPPRGGAAASGSRVAD